MVLGDVLNKTHFTRDDLIYLLSLTDEAAINAVYDKAYAVKAEYVGQIVYYRGLIEFSNYCIKDCLYCGIRRSNSHAERFDTEREDILAMARWACQQGYGSLTLQSGERQDEAFIGHVERLVRDIKKLSGGQLGVTLCVGEQTEETYRRWFDAGAHRYLLRIETSNPALYAKIHPQDGHHDWHVRRDCLLRLRRAGYQVGTGVMIGLPGQTIGDLADDILFYKDMDIDMIGMGPYVVHHDTPLGQEVLARGLDSAAERKRRLRLSLLMIAVTRLVLRDVNIASTTALQALDPQGRERGFKAGANVVMPIVTVPKFRAQYTLYDNKPCIDDTPGQCRDCLASRIAAAGDTVGLGKWGDSPHFRRKKKQRDGSSGHDAL